MSAKGGELDFPAPIRSEAPKRATLLELSKRCDLFESPIHIGAYGTRHAAKASDGMTRSVVAAGKPTYKIRSDGGAS